MVYDARDSTERSIATFLRRHELQPRAAEVLLAGVRPFAPPEKLRAWQQLAAERN